MLCIRARVTFCPPGGLRVYMLFCDASWDCRDSSRGNRDERKGKEVHERIVRVRFPRVIMWKGTLFTIWGVRMYVISGLHIILILSSETDSGIMKSSLKCTAATGEGGVRERERERRARDDVMFWRCILWLACLLAERGKTLTASEPTCRFRGEWRGAHRL